MNRLELRRCGMLHAKVPRLPKEYQEVAYLENTGGQWIDSGIIGNQDTYVLYDFALVEISDSFLFGSRMSAMDRAFYFVIRGGIWFACSYNQSGNLDYYKNGVAYNADLERHVNTLHKGEATIDGITRSVGSYSNFETPKTLALFGLNGPNGFHSGPKIKVYSCILKNNDTPQRNFIPCYRKSDTKPGMYDLVTKTFFTNAGTGEFICGPKV